MEIDAFEAKNVRVTILEELATVLCLCNKLPKYSLKGVPYDLVLCTGDSFIVTCEVPKRWTVKGFVQELCFLLACRSAPFSRTGPVNTMRPLAYFIRASKKHSTACSHSDLVHVKCTRQLTVTPKNGWYS